MAFSLFGRGGEEKREERRGQERRERGRGGIEDDVMRRVYEYLECFHEMHFASNTSHSADPLSLSEVREREGEK